MSKILIIAIEEDEMMSDRYQITTQVKGFPKTTGFLDDDLVGLTYDGAIELAKELVKEEKKSNPDFKIVKRGFK